MSKHFQRAGIALIAGVCTWFGLAQQAGADWFDCIGGLAVAGLIYVCIEV